MENLKVSNCRIFQEKVQPIGKVLQCLANAIRRFLFKFRVKVGLIQKKVPSKYNNSHQCARLLLWSSVSRIRHAPFLIVQNCAHEFDESHRNVFSVCQKKEENFSPISLKFWNYRTIILKVGKLLVQMIATVKLSKFQKILNHNLLLIITFPVGHFESNPNDNWLTTETVQ